MTKKTKEDKEFEKILAIISLKSHGNDCLCSQCQVDKKKLDGEKNEENQESKARGKKIYL